MVVRSSVSRAVRPSVRSTIGSGGSSGGGVSYDEDAAAYFSAVETADGETLEAGVKDAINAFVVGCKSDGIWDAIKASCILAGARTLAGALVPLVGAAPTNFNFVSGDYSRTNGVTGNSTTKYIDTNRNNNTDPQNDSHQSVYILAASSGTGSFYIGAGVTNVGSTHIGRSGVITNLITRNRSSVDTGGAFGDATGLLGFSRSASGNFQLRAKNATSTITRSSEAPFNSSVHVFGTSGTTGARSNATIGFYSIGEAIELALLDARVSALISAIGTALA